jgi:hypothetical protein
VKLFEKLRCVKTPPCENHLKKKQVAEVDVDTSLSSRTAQKLNNQYLSGWEGWLAPAHLCDQTHVLIVE